MSARARLAVVGGALAIAPQAVAAQTDSVPAPAKLWAAQTTASQITLVWKLAPGATGYVLYRDAGAPSNNSAAEAQPKVATLASNVSRYVYVVRGAQKGAEQFYLQATGANGRESARLPFNPVTLVTTPVPPVPPASANAKETSPGVITLTWPASPGATAYALGRSAGPSGFTTLCGICPTELTYVDSGVTNGMRYQYSVAAITPSGVSVRTLSNVLIPGVVATGGGTTGTGGTGSTGGGTGTTGGGVTPGGTGNTTLTTTPDPLRGRYRVRLTGFTVQAQTYDHLLQIDGKGDEVFLATHVMRFDTSSANLVLSNEVRTSRVYGDVSGFSYRVQAGTAGSTGGLATGNVVPSPKGLVSDIPMVLWEGELVQGRSAVVIAPTVWEWDDNPELFGNWLTGRDALLTRLLQAEPMAAILLNRDIQPVEIGAGGLFVHTNMFGDARDRPIGLKPGQPANGAGFFGPLPLDPKSGTTTTSYVSNSSAVVGRILPRSLFFAVAEALLKKLFAIINMVGPSLGTTAAHVLLPDGEHLPDVLGSIAAGVKPAIGRVMQAQPAIGLRQVATVLTMANPSSASTDLYFFEKMIALTPQAIDAAIAQSKSPGAALIDVQYIDYGSLQGKYTVHLKVERVP